MIGAFAEDLRSVGSLYIVRIYLRMPHRLNCYTVLLLLRLSCYHTWLMRGPRETPNTPKLCHAFFSVHIYTLTLLFLVLLFISPFLAATVLILLAVTAV